MNAFAPVVMSLALFFASLIGLTLGIFGGGGSLLSVPALTLGLHMDPKSAVAYGLVMLSGAAFVVSLLNLRAQLVDMKSIIHVGIPAAMGSFAGSLLAIYLSGKTQLILFASVMFVAVVATLRGQSVREEVGLRRIVLAFVGLSVGVVAGLVGAGGGFLMVPALLMSGVPLRRAAATSTALIFVQSLLGALVHVRAHPLSVSLTFVLLAGSIAGSIAGFFLAQRIRVNALRSTFAVLVFAIAMLTMKSATNWMTSLITGSLTIILILLRRWRQFHHLPHSS